MFSPKGSSRLVAEAAGVVAPAGLGLDRDDARLRVAELGRRRAGGHRRLFQRVGADADLGAQRAHVVAAPVAGVTRHAVDVGDRFVGAAAADRERVAVGAGRHDARLEGQHAVQSVDRQIAGELAVDPLLRGHLVSRHQRLGLGDDGDLLDLDRGLLQLDVDRDGLAGEHLHAVDLGRLVADERGPDAVGAGRYVVDEVVALRIRERVERGAHDEHLRVGDGRARLVTHPAFDLTSRALGEERTGSQAQSDCREREAPRGACEGAYTALLHGYVLQRRGPAITASLEREAYTPPLSAQRPKIGMRLRGMTACIV